MTHSELDRDSAKEGKRKRSAMEKKEIKGETFSFHFPLFFSFLFSYLDGETPFLIDLFFLLRKK